MRAVIHFTLGTLAMISVGTITDAQAPAGGSSGAGLKACSILSEAEILQITKKTNRLNMRAEQTYDTKNVSECEFIDYGFSLVTGVTPQSFDASRKQQATAKNVEVKPVSGVGDDAFYYVRHQGSVTVVAIIMRVGHYRLSIQDMVPEDSIEVAKGPLLALAKAAVPRLNR